MLAAVFLVLLAGSPASSQRVVRIAAGASSAAQPSNAGNARPLSKRFHPSCIASNFTVTAAGGNPALPLMPDAYNQVCSLAGARGGGGWRGGGGGGGGALRFVQRGTN